MLLNSENLKTSPLDLSTRQKNPLAKLLFNEVLAIALILKKKKKKNYPYWKGRDKIITICTWHDTL